MTPYSRIRLVGGAGEPNITFFSETVQTMPKQGDKNKYEILVQLFFGKFKPSGKLPVELPSSVEAVKAQLEDVPHNSKDPLYLYGFGLTYN